MAFRLPDLQSLPPVHEASDRDRYGERASRFAVELFAALPSVSRGVRQHEVPTSLLSSPKTARIFSSVVWFSEGASMLIAVKSRWAQR